MAKIKGWYKFSSDDNKFIGYKTNDNREEISILRGTGKDKGNWWLKIRTDNYVHTSMKGISKTKALDIARSYMKITLPNIDYMR